jgi:hypothetical protein
VDSSQLLFSHVARGNERTYLHKNELGWVGDAPEESVEDRKYLLGYFDRCEDDERQLSERRGWLREVQKVDMRETEQGRHWFRACNRLKG